MSTYRLMIARRGGGLSGPSTGIVRFRVILCGDRGVPPLLRCSLREGAIMGGRSGGAMDALAFDIEDLEAPLSVSERFADIWATAACPRDCEETHGQET